MKRDRGAALLLVLLLVALLAVLVLEFHRRAQVDLSAAESLHDDVQAHALLRSGSDLADQVLAVYNKISIADMKSGATLKKGGDLLWKFLFQEEPLDIPVPTVAVAGMLGLRAQLQDLYGRFPLGALVGQNVDPRRTVFKHYLGHVKEYLASREDKALDGVDMDSVAENIFTYLDQYATAKMPMEHLTELNRVEGLTPEVVRALTPFLDVRVEWKFNVNSRCVPLIMTMQAKNVQEATDDRSVLQTDPVETQQAIANSALLTGINPEFPNSSLDVKSSRVQILLEATVGTGRRRARGIFEKPQATAAGATDRFQLVEWAEGWIEEEMLAPEAKPEAPAPGSSTASSQTAGASASAPHGGAAK